MFFFLIKLSLHYKDLILDNYGSVSTTKVQSPILRFNLYY